MKSKRRRAWSAYFDSGCACYYSRRSVPDGILFATDPGSHGQIKAGSKLIALTAFSSDQMVAKAKGVKYSLKFTADGYEVSFIGHRTSDCPAAKPECMEMTSLGSLTVQTGKNAETIEVAGSCDSCN